MALAEGPPISSFPNAVAAEEAREPANAMALAEGLPISPIPDAAAEAARERLNSPRRRVAFFIVVALGLGLGIGLCDSSPSATAATAATTAVTLSTPAVALTFALALALRCDVARALAPLGTTLAQVTLVSNTSVAGTTALLDAADPVNAISSCSARALQGRSLPAAPTCEQPLSQELSSVKLVITNTGDTGAVHAALARCAYTCACCGSPQPAAKRPP